MSDTTPLDPILSRFLDNRESLSDHEFALLLEALRTGPQLAERLKDHLMMDEQLAQQYAMDRKDFVEKFEHRLKEESLSSVNRNAGASDDSSAETYALSRPGQADTNGNAARVGNGSALTEMPRSSQKPGNSVSEKPISPVQGSSHPRLIFFTVMAGLFLLAGGLMWLEYTPAARKIAEVDEVAGMVFIYRHDVGIVAAAGMPILPGDEIRAKEDGHLELMFRDQSQVKIGSGSHIIFQPGTGQLPGALTSELAKTLLVLEGTLEADVKPQPPSRPMVLDTPHATAKVLGTRLIVTALEKQSRVEVIEGLVEVQSHEQGVPPVEISAGHQVIASQGTLQVSPGDWPVNTNGLVFLLSPGANVSRSANEGVQIFAEGSDQSTSVLRPRKDAVFQAGRMEFRGGAFLADDDTATALLEACRQSNELSLEATFQTSDLSQTGPARWITFSTHSKASNFSLAQEGNQCVLRLLTSGKQPEQQHEIPLFSLPDDLPHHVVVTYAEDQLRCYLDGKPIKVSANVAGTFAAWKPEHLLFGDEWNGDREWRGKLAGVAIYNRALPADEIARNAMHFQLRFRF